MISSRIGKRAQHAAFVAVFLPSGQATRLVSAPEGKSIIRALKWSRTTSAHTASTLDSGDNRDDREQSFESHWRGRGELRKLVALENHLPSSGPPFIPLWTLYKRANIAHLQPSDEPSFAEVGVCTRMVQSQLDRFGISSTVRIAGTR